MHYHHYHRFFSPNEPRGHPFCFQMDGGFPGNNLNKDSRPSDPYPTGRHTRAPERIRKWRPDHGEAIVPSVSVAIPALGCHFFKLPETVKTVSYLSMTPLRTGCYFLWQEKWGWSLKLITSSRICRQTESGKYASLQSLQFQMIVWEVCFCTYMCHTVFQSGLRGIIPLRNLLAPSWPAGTAICCCETLHLRQPISLWASTGLLNYNISKMFCKGLKESKLSLGTS